MGGEISGSSGGPPARPYGFWGLCLSLVVLVAAGFGLLAGGAWVLRAAGMASPAIGAAETAVLAALDDRLDLVVTLSAEVVAICGLAALARWRGGRRWRDLLALRRWSPIRAGWRYWLLVVATVLYGLAASILIGNLYPQSQSWDRMPAHPLPTVVFLVLAVVMAPAAEELLFRGWIFTALRARRGALAAIVLSAAAFAAAHDAPSHLYAAAVFPIGLALGRAREKTGSILASGLLHGTYNLVLTGVGLLVR